MDFLASHIAAKKKEIKCKRNVNKYKTRGEIEREKEEERRKLEQKQQPKEIEEEEMEEEVVEDERKQPTMPVKQVMKLLRKLGEPITFFGETDLERELRYLKLEDETEDAEFRSGINDDFGLDIKEMDETIENIKAGEEFDEEKEKDHEEKLKKTEQMLLAKQTMTQEEEILVYFRGLLKLWESDLDERTEAQKRTAQGKVATATYRQTVRNLRPLFKLLIRKRCLPDILHPLYQIVQNLKKKEYVSANGDYLKLAIGNAAWPMGVTMVGIHARSAREKIFSNQVAHILNDETQRKYIQAVKRLMTYAQKKYPNDPSKNIG